MKRTCQHPRLLALAVTAVGILLDQLTKLLVSGGMALGDTIPILKDVLHITYVRNTGAAFGMLSDRRWVFLVISTVTILALAVFLLRTSSRDPLLIVSLSMILSGGIGNMIDRLALGYVVDFIDFRLINFAVFNGADSFVCVVAALLFLAVLFEPKKEEEQPAAGDGTSEEDSSRDA
jgi:signal peptidase II